MVKKSALITYAFGGVLQFTPAVMKAERDRTFNKRSTEALAREYYGNNKLKRKDVRATKLMDFEGIVKSLM